MSSRILTATRSLVIRGALLAFIGLPLAGCTDTDQNHLNCGETPHGNSESRPCYDSATVPSGESCTYTTQTRTCDDGVWSPDFPECSYLTCSVEQGRAFTDIYVNDLTVAEGETGTLTTVLAAPAASSDVLDWTSDDQIENTWRNENDGPRPLCSQEADSCGSISEAICSGEPRTCTAIYKAPACAGDTCIFRIRATSHENPGIGDYGIITVLGSMPPVVITISPTTAVVETNSTQQFTASVTGSSNTEVIWEVEGTDCGTVTTSGLYSAPSSIPAGACSVKATSVADSSKSVGATITVTGGSVESEYFGFGSLATGGFDHEVIHVTNLDNSGDGSLRNALSGGDRMISFDVGGTITLTSPLYIKDANITVDGATAPVPGITIVGPSISIIDGANNVILTNFRHRGGEKDQDNISIFRGSHNIVLDHLSLSNSYDENVGIWDSNHDITIQNCIIGNGNPAGSRYAMLISHMNLRVSVYRNLFHNAYYRQPAVGYDDTGVEVAPSIVGDIVNNVVWDYPTYGTTVYWGGKANVVGNYYYTSYHPGESNRAVNTESLGESYSFGNYSKDGSSVNGTTLIPFTVDEYAQITADDAVEAAVFVRDHAGCRVGGLDALDASIIEELEF